MRTGRLIVFSPGLRQVWKFNFSTSSLLVPVLASMLGLIVIGTVGYIEPLLSSVTNDAHTSRLVVENGTLSMEKRAAEFEIRRLSQRARKLEEQTSRIAADLEE